MMDFNSPFCKDDRGPEETHAKDFCGHMGNGMERATPTFHLPKCIWNYRKQFFLYVRLANYLNTITNSNPLSKIKTTNTIIFPGLILSQKVREELQTIILGLKASSKTSLL